jgi:SAM-dependent methyltransferase
LEPAAALIPATEASGAGDPDYEDPEKWLSARQQLYDHLTAPYPTLLGKHVSKADRERMESPPTTLTYGEIDFTSFSIALNKIRRVYGRPGVGATPAGGIMQRPGGTFCDIGSGTGKPSIAAALCHPFDLVAGVEVLPGLHALSLQLAARFNEHALTGLRAAADASTANPPAHRTRVAFTCGDGCDLAVLDWLGADVCFANSTCFTDAMMARMAAAAESLKRGAFFITFTKKLPSASFTVLDQKVFKMSWGGATVFIQQKLTDPVPPGPADNA